MDWSRVSTLLDQILDMPADRRLAEARRLAGADDALYAELADLIERSSTADDFLSPPLAPGRRMESDDPEGRLAAGQRLGAWEIVGLIGRGGMGEVYLAQRADGAFRQDAALKILGPLDEDGVVLFERERQTIALLEHPGIARLLDGGVDDDGRPFMVVERVEGRPIDQWCTDNALSAADRIGLVLSVCECIEYAHARLVIHRDIKPSNILVDEAGRARLIDFGVSAEVGSDELRPLTARYASPETLRHEPAGTAADIYALAATLFELLAGQPPAETGHSALSLAAWAAQGAPVTRLSDMPAAAALPGPLRADISAILDKALSARPEARYRSAGAFADDLRRALAHHPVHARPNTPVYRAGRFLWRNAAASLAVAALFTVLAGGLGLSMWQQRQISAERDNVVREQTRLAAVQDYLFFMLRDSAEAGEDRDIGSILDGAADRVVARMAEDPETSAGVLHALSELYFHINDYEAAAPLLRRVVAEAGIDPAVRATAAYDLAQVSQRQGDTEAAAEQLTAAQRFWRTDPIRFERQIVDSRLVEARLLRDAGDAAAAIALLEDALPQQIRLNGADFRLTGVFHNDLGVMLFSAGRFEDAARELHRARDIWELNGLDTGPDALNTLNNLAAVEFLLGHGEQAAPLFAEAIALREQLYGESAALAAALGNHGKVLISLGEFDAAAASLQRGRDMALSFAGPGSLHFASASAGLMEALIGQGDRDRARAVLGTDRALLTDAVDADSVPMAVFDVGAARVAAESGEVGEAGELLIRAEAVFEGLGPSGRRYISVINSLRETYGLPAEPPSVPGAARRAP